MNTCKCLEKYLTNLTIHFLVIKYETFIFLSPKVIYFEILIIFFFFEIFIISIKYYKIWIVLAKIASKKKDF